MSHGIIADKSDYPPMSSYITYIFHYLENKKVVDIGLLIKKSWIRLFFREDYYLDHPGHTFSFSVIGRKTLFNYVDFIHTALYFDLPKCRGHLGGAFLDFYQHFQCVLKERISPAYWLVCKKAR